METVETGDHQSRLAVLAQRLATALQFPYPTPSKRGDQSGTDLMLGRGSANEVSIHLRIGHSFPHSREAGLSVYRLMDEAAMSVDLPLSGDGKQGRILTSMPGMEGAGFQFIGHDLDHLEAIVKAIEQQKETFRAALRTIYLQDNAINLIVANSLPLHQSLNNAHAQGWEGVIRQARAASGGEPAATLLEARLARKTDRYADGSAENFIHQLVQEESVARGAEKAALTQLMTDFGNLVPLFAPWIAQQRADCVKPVVGEWTQDAVSKDCSGAQRG